jgi:hypothetical protein
MAPACVKAEARASVRHMLFSLEGGVWPWRQTGSWHLLRRAAEAPAYVTAEARVRVK